MESTMHPTSDTQPADLDAVPSPQISSPRTNRSIFPNGVSGRLIAVYLGLQIVDLIILSLAWRLRVHQFRINQLSLIPGLNPIAGFFVMKAAAFVCLITSVYSGRRRLLVFLNFWYAGLIIWNLAMVM